MYRNSPDYFYPPTMMIELFLPPAGQEKMEVVKVGSYVVQKKTRDEYPISNRLGTPSPQHLPKFFIKRIYFSARSPCTLDSSIWRSKNRSTVMFLKKGTWMPKVIPVVDEEK